MARHTIGDRRGSVRGAPPDVYLGFMSEDGPDPAEQWAPTFRFFKSTFIVIPVCIIIGFVLWVFWCSLTGKPIYPE